MNMQEVREIARNFGIKPGKAKKTDLIRTIQAAEGNFDCFGTAFGGDCDQQTCLWRDDCFNQARKLRPV